MSLLSKGLRLLDALVARESLPLTYCRGSLRIAWEALPGRTATGMLQAGRTGLPRVQMIDRDWIGPAALLARLHVPAEPQPGDTIIELMEGGRLQTVWSVVPGPTHARCWDYVDPLKRQIRVHAKQREVGPVPAVG